ncbi:citryl-CoA lyase [Microbacterium sp. A93]|uniref:citryl-CoA lyase n=1 Tax=Microbacterium sp. A93 TaxID=3450716 RepID=UPI003F41F2A3
MAESPRRLRTDIASSTSERITIRGLDFSAEILGHMDLASFSFLQLTGRRATASQAKVYEAMLMTLVEHGITPSSLAARLTYVGAPEAMQGAVAAGLLGLGGVFVGSAEGAARILSEADISSDAVKIRREAKRIVSQFAERREPIPGIGHHLHKPVDPRTVRLWEIAQESGLSGPYVALMKEISVVAEATKGAPMPVNATGAVGALACELGLSWHVVRGIGVMSRAIGLVGHILEESESPMAIEIWRRAEEEATAHVRPQSAGRSGAQP